MRSGRLRHRVTIKERVDGKDLAGGIVYTYTEFARVWASVEPIRTEEIFAAGQVQSRATTKIVVRYRPGLRANMVIEHEVENGTGSPSLVKIYEVVGEPIHINNRLREVHFMCVQRDSEGFRSE